MSEDNPFAALVAAKADANPFEALAKSPAEDNPFVALSKSQTVKDSGWDSSKSDQWNTARITESKAALSAGLPPVVRRGDETDSRIRMMDAIARAESAGYPTPHFMGLPNEPEGDRAPTMDMESLVKSLASHEQDAIKSGNSSKAQSVAKERAFWENQIATSGMSKELWKKQTGEDDPVHTEANQALSSANRFADVAMNAGRIMAGDMGALAERAARFLPELKSRPEQVGAPAPEDMPMVSAREPTPIADAWEKTKRFFTPILGPTKQEEYEQAIPVQNPDGSTSYVYKPQGNEAEKRGLLPSIIAAGSALVDLPSIYNLQKRGEGTTLTDVDRERQNQMLAPSPDDSTATAILKATHNATLNLSHTLANPLFVKIPSSRVLSGAFGADMLHGAWEQAQQAMNAPTLQGKIEGWIGAITGLGMGYLAGKQAISGSSAPPISHAETAKILTHAPDEALEAAVSDPKLTEHLPGEIQQMIADEQTRRKQAHLETVAPLTAQAVKDSSAVLETPANGTAGAPEPISPVSEPPPKPYQTPSTAGETTLSTAVEQPPSGQEPAPIAPGKAAAEAARVPVAPKLQKVQTQGDLLGGSEDLTLVGEKLKSEPPAPPKAEPTVQQTVEESVQAYGDVVSAHQHLQTQIDALAGDKASKPTVERLRAAQRKIENIMEDEHRREELAQHESDQQEKGYELLSSVKELGGLPTLGEKGRYATGELKRIAEASKGAFLRFFRKGAKSLDRLRESLNERGFAFKTPEEMLMAVEDSLATKRPKYGDLFPEGYRGGPGAMGPVEAEFQRASRELFQSAHDPINIRRIREGRDELFSEERKRDSVTWDEAQARMEADPNAGSTLVEKLNSGAKTSVSDVEDLMLTHRLIDLKAARDLEGDRAADPYLSAAERAVHSAEWDKLEGSINETEKAARVAGTASGRALRIRRLQIADDYTLEGLSGKWRKTLNRALTKEESDYLSSQSDRIAKAQEAANAAEIEQQAAQIDASTDTHVAALEKEVDRLNKADEARPKFSDQVLEHARKVVERWEAEAKEVDTRLRDFFGSESGAVGGVGGPKGEGRNLRGQQKRAATQQAVSDLAKVIRAKVGRFGLKQAETLTALVAQYGEGVRPFFSKAWAEFQKIVNSEFKDKPAKVKEAIKTGAGKPSPEKSRDVVSRAKAEATAGEPLSHKTIYEIAEQHVKSGLRGTDAVMKATHETVKQAYPDATERDVRRAFSQYGEVKFPNPDAVKTELRDIRVVARLHESIDRIKKDALDPLRTGQQRDKLNLEAREKQKELNELLKQRAGPPSPEKLASRNEAKVNALKNRIEEIDKQLRTGEKPGQPARMPDSTEVEQLKSERDAMLEKLREIDAEKNPPPPEHIAELKRLQDRVDEVRDRLARMELDRPKAEGKPTAYTKEIAAAKAELKSLNDTIRELRKPVPLSDAQKALDSAQVARERVAQTLDDISTGKTKSAAITKEALTQLEEDVKLETGALKQLVAEMRREAKPKTDPGYAKEQAQIRALEKAIETYEQNTAKGDFTTVGKQFGPDTRRVAQLKEIRDSRSAAYKAARDAGKPVRSPEERYNDTRMKALTNREAELKERLRAGNFAPRSKRVMPELKADVLKKKAAVESLKLEVDRAAEKERLRKRTRAEKVLDGIVKWNRTFILSGIHTLAKLTSAAGEIVAITPIEEAVGGVISKIPGVSRVAEKAPRHGGFSLRAEKEAVVGSWKNLLRDAASNFKTGHTDLDLLYGKPNLAPRELKDYIANIHGALKSPAKRNEFIRSFEKRVEHAARNGRDVADPMVQTQLSIEAYKDANRSIFREDNMVVSMWRRGLSALKQTDKATGRPSLRGKIVETALNVSLPIVRIPTNIVARTFEYSLGSLSGSVRLARAMAEGLDKLNPDEADAIIRNLKRGSVGAGLMLYGYFNADKIGGYYQQGEKREKKDVKVGEMRVNGVDVPRYLIHNPLLEQFQIGATIRRVADSRLNKKDAETQGIGAGAFAAALGLADETPFVDEAKRLSRLYSPHERMSVAGETVKQVIPQGVQQVAAMLDRDAKGNPISRKPKTFGEHLKVAIPGLRKTVPARSTR